MEISQADLFWILIVQALGYLLLFMVAGIYIIRKSTISLVDRIVKEHFKAQRRSFEEITESKNSRILQELQHYLQLYLANVKGEWQREQKQVMLELQNWTQNLMNENNQAMIELIQKNLVTLREELTSIMNNLNAVIQETAVKDGQVLQALQQEITSLKEILRQVDESVKAIESRFNFSQQPMVGAESDTSIW